MEVIQYCANNRRLFLLGVSLFVIMLVTGIYSMSNEVISTINTLSTSAVDIELKEYDQNNNLFDEDIMLVMPGDKIKLVTKVNNIGTDCYIRAKLIYKINNQAIDEKNYIDGNYKLWNEKEGYYYYEPVFYKKNTIELFNELKIPDNLSSSSSGNGIVTLTIQVEAVQSKNFDGNWDNVEIKKSVNRTYDVDYEGELPIIYENDSKKYINLDDDFFYDAGVIVPGDTISEVININNKSSDENKFYLSIDYNNLTSEEINLLNKIKVTIAKENGDIIVNDNLTNIKNIVLGTYKSGEKDKLIISLNLPLDSDNDYSKLLLKILFRFYAENQSDDAINPFTGDKGIDIYFATFIMSSIGFIIVLLVEKKNTLSMKKNNIEKGSE